MRLFPRTTWIMPWVIAFAASQLPASQAQAIWIPANGQSAYFQVNLLKVEQGTLYAIDESGASDRRLRRSDDLGDNWSMVGPPFLSNANIGAMEILGSQIFLMTWGDGVWRLSSPEDTAWKRVNSGLRNTDSLNHMALFRSSLLLAAEYGFFSWSSAEDRWIPAGDTIGGNLGLGARSIAVTETTLFVTAVDGYLYRGAPSGTGWTWSELPLRGGSSIIRIGRFLFAVGRIAIDSKPSVFRSEDNGTTWLEKAASLPTDNQTASGPVLLAKVGANLFASLYDGGMIYLSTDDGETWAPFADRPEGRPAYFNSLGTVGSELFGMSEEGLYRLSTGFSSIRRIPGKEAFRFGFQQGSHTLQYRFDAPGWARLDLITPTGRLAVPVFQGIQTGGTRAFPLTPRVGPGTYLLRLETERAEKSHMLRLE